MDTKPQPIANLTTVDRDITDLAAMELADVLKEATAAGFGAKETIEAIEGAIRQYRNETTSVTGSTDPLEAVATAISTARDAGMSYGNERIIYLLGLAMDEIKADRKKAG